MSITIKINSGEDKPFAVEIAHLPVEVRLEKPIDGLSILPMGLFALVFLYIAVSSFLPSFVMPALVVAGGGYVLFAIFVLKRAGHKHILRFEQDHVRVTESGLLRDRHWQAAYSEFKGVYLRRRQAKSGRTQTTYQIIELKHPDKQKTLPLFVDKTKSVPKNRWNAYAKIFQLAAVREGT